MFSPVFFNPFLGLRFVLLSVPPRRGWVFFAAAVSVTVFEALRLCVVFTLRLLYFFFVCLFSFGQPRVLVIRVGRLRLV